MLLNRFSDSFARPTRAYPPATALRTDKLSGNACDAASRISTACRTLPLSIAAPARPVDAASRRVAGSGFSRCAGDGRTHVGRLGQGAGGDPYIAGSVVART